MTTPTPTADNDSEVNATDHPDDLPHPQEDPDIRYLHEGKQYTVFDGRTFEIVRWDRDGPAGGIVVVEWVNEPGHPPHESNRDDAGISHEALQSWIDKYGDEGGVLTGNCILRGVRELNIGEVDPNSYTDLYYGE